VTGGSQFGRRLQIEFRHAILCSVVVHEREFSPAVEDYAKAIYALEHRSGAPVGTAALAERLDVTPGSVSAMLRKLGALGLVTHVPYHGVQLTREGARVALEVIRHHRLLETYLADQLGVPLGPRP
jgi:DtxR family Mn-dependent transcriptional regulator